MFDTNFQLYLADTGEAELAHHRVRYQVFCQERGFEDPAAFCGDAEWDDWDLTAAKFAVASKETGAWVGACRLIMPNASSFPVETLGCSLPKCADSIPRHQIAEVSRVCVAKSSPESQMAAIKAPFLVDVGAVTARQESEVHIGLIRATIAYGLDHDISYVYMLVTPALQRLLGRLGVVFVGAGSAVEHRGTRTPCLVDLEASRITMSRRSNKVSAMLMRKHLAYQSHMACSQPKLARPRPAVRRSFREELAAV